MMAGIRGKDTKPELIIRRGLHARGFRYRLHDGKLPGKPDLVFSSRQAVILIHGCFWHGHDCDLFRWPGSRIEFWREKITRNRERDACNLDQLAAAGWRVLVLWECSLKGRVSRPAAEIIDAAARWLRSGHDMAEIRGVNRAAD